MAENKGKAGVAEKTEETQTVEEQRVELRIEKLEGLLTVAQARMMLMETRIQQLERSGVGKSTQRFGTAHAAKKVLDTKTGITYDSLYKCGLALAEEFGVEKNNQSWYNARKINPEAHAARFQIQENGS